MKNWSMRIFTLISLLMFSSIALADNSISADAVTNHTDLSIAYLSQVFGTVGNSLQGTSGQMLGMLFYKFNQGILVVAGIWLSYLVLTTFLKSAHEGNFISPNRNIVIILLRVALGFGLLLPNPVTGYSIFQDILMKVVVSGVSLADETWSYGLQYVDNGGSVWHDAGASNKDGGTSIISANDAKKILGTTQMSVTTSFSDLGVAQKIFLDEVCMYEAAGTSASVVQTPTQFIFPGTDKASTSGCGSVTWHQGTGSEASTTQYSQQAASAMVSDLLPAARRYVCMYDQSANGCLGDTTDPSLEIGNAFFNSGLGYANAVLPATQDASSSADKLSRQFIQQAEAGGWMLAGRYYWDLSQAVSTYKANTDITTYLPEVAKPELLADPGPTAGQNKNINQLLQTAMGFTGGYVNTAMTYLANYSNASAAGGAHNNATVGDVGGISNMPGMMQLMLFPYFQQLDDLVNMFSSTNSSYSYNPILFLHNIGMECLGIAGWIWVGTAITMMLLSVVTIFCNSYVNAYNIFATLSGWIKPMMMVIATALLGVGIMLGYYVPLYPYMLFTFGVIGWIIRVMVGMAAAPLVCLSLTHPEGHDFLGVAQQALMLLLGVFIEPVLMIIGLIGGMIVSYVSLKIVIYTFSGFLSDLFYGQLGPAVSGSPSLLSAAQTASANFATQNVGGSVLIGLAFPIFLIVFTSIVYTVTNTSFSLIYALPSGVMDWIGGPKIQNTSEQMAGVVSGALSQAGSKFGGGMQAGEIMQPKKENKESEKAKADKREGEMNKKDGASQIEVDSE